MSNPYATPNAVVGDIIEDDTYEPRIFATSGRIGRIRYIAYSVLANFAIAIPAGLIAGFLSAGGRKGAPAGLMLIIYGPMLAIYLVMAKRRLNDLNRSGWLSLLMLVPLINLLFGLYLTFWPGDEGSNDYGPAPAGNSLLLTVAGLLLPLAIIGMVAAVAIPAYQNYVKRAQHAQTFSHPAP